MSDSSKKGRKTLSALGHALHSSKKSTNEKDKMAQSTEFVKNESISTSSQFDTPSFIKRPKDHPPLDKRPASEHSNQSYASGEGRAASQSARSLPSDSGPPASQALKVSIVSEEKEGDEVDSSVHISDSWNDQIVDVPLTLTTLQYLDQTIVEMKDILANTQKARQSNVANFLIRMDETGSPNHAGHKTPKEQYKMRSAFEIGNKQSNKQEQEIQVKLEYLERCRRLVGANGVPKGVTMKAHLKSLRKMGDKKISSKMFEEVVRSNQPTEKKADKTISSQRSRIKYPSNENLSQPRETSFPKPQSRDKLGISRSLKDSAIHGGSVGALDNHSNQQALSLTPSRHLDSSGAGDLSRRFHTLQNPSQSSAGNPSGKNFSGNTQVTVTEQYGATPSHFSVHTEGKTSRSSGGDRERERIRLDSSSMTGSIGTEQELSHQLQSGIQSKMLEELQALRCDLQLLDESSRRLEAQLKELQRNTKTDSEYSAQHIDSIARKVDKLEARTDEFKLFTDSKLQAHATNFKNLEGRFEYWMGNALRNLHDSIEGVENQVKQLENRVGNLAQRPSSSWWNHSDSSLQNHFITSLLHLLAFLAIVVSYILQLFLKSINYATHMLQHRSGLSVMIMLLFVLLVCYKWIPFFEDTIDTQLSYMWQWIQRYLRKS